MTSRTMRNDGCFDAYWLTCHPLAATNALVRRGRDGGKDQVITILAKNTGK